MESSLVKRLVRIGRGTLGPHAHYVAFLLLALMFILGLTSMRNDSASFDEVAHILGGYSYIRFGDYRINPEHPPLIKDFGGLLLQFLDLKFPKYDESWTSAAWMGQWDTGRRFLYSVGNDADRILFWARLPNLVFATGFGGFLFGFCRKHWGSSVALLVTFFYALSPNMLAHARYVTTDVAASALFFFVLVTLSRFLERPVASNVALLGLALAGAQAGKFSAFALYPFTACVVLVAIWLWASPVRLWSRVKVYGGGAVLACLLSGAIVWAFYYPHTIGMPVEVQDRLIISAIVPGKLASFGYFLTRLNKLPLMKPVAEYALGLVMIVGRVKTGTWTYFNGNLIQGSFRTFFPEVFLVKTQVAFLIMAGASWLACALTKRARFGKREAWIGHVRTNPFVWIAAVFAGYYFALAVAGNLNLGIRHILPVYPPVFVIAAITLVPQLQQLSAAASTPRRVVPLAAAAILLCWYAISTFLIHPSYLAYFNELAGGPQHGDALFNNSSLDWGQDLRRLRSYVTAHPEIKRLAVDYFGGGDVKYYFCAPSPAKSEAPADATTFDCRNSVLDEWQPSDGQYTGQYLAVSETTLTKDPFFGNFYKALRQQTPIAKIGYSIHLYKLR